MERNLLTKDYRPRLNVEISQDQFNALQQLIPHGLKNHMIRAILDCLINVLQNAPDRPRAMALILEKSLDIPRAVLLGGRIEDDKEQT